LKKCGKKLLGQGKQGMQWPQGTWKIKEYNLNNRICGVSRHFRNKKNQYLKERISKLKINSKYKNIRDLYRVINKFMKRYQTRSKLKKAKMVI
jgi:hypothetical protein